MPNKPENVKEDAVGGSDLSVGLDAARYRWLKQNCQQDIEDKEEPQLVHKILWKPNWRELLDEAIDEAISEASNVK